MVAWLSSIKDKNLNGCGKLVLTGDMSELSITKVDLSNMNTLEGKLSCCLIGGEALTQDLTLGSIKLQYMVESSHIHTLFSSAHCREHRCAEGHAADLPGLGWN